MQLEEFSNEFDILYNNVMSNQAPGLTEYEKSVFLTRAQDDIIKAYFNPKLNKTQEGFDGNERRQIDFSRLMRTVECKELPSKYTTTFLHSGTNIKSYAIPSDILLYINEAIIAIRDTRSVRLIIVPLDYTEYNRLMSKAYKRPLKNQAWRLIAIGRTSIIETDYNKIVAAICSDPVYTNVDKEIILNTINGKSLKVENNGLRVGKEYLNHEGSTSATISSADKFNLPATETTLTSLIEGTSPADIPVSPISSVQIIPGPNDTITKYIIRYVARPTPIILTDLKTEELTIDGYSTKLDCALDPILHHEILQRAVELAKAAYSGDLTSNIILGQNSGTPMGVVTSQKQ